MINSKVKIQKTIHYCWFSDEPFPPLILKCLKSWEKYLPNYKFRLWNYETFPRGKSIWVDEAVDAGKYAFAADYIRAYALYTEGGIYLDSDVEVLKSFDDLLYLPYFIGKENGGLIEAAVMGSEKGNNLFRYLLNYYDEKKHFRNTSGELDTTALPKIIMDIINKDFVPIYVNSVDGINDDKTKCFILPWDYFSPKAKNGKISISQNTYTIHHFNGGWLTASQLIKKRIIRMLGPSMTSYIVNVKRVIRKKIICHR